MYVYTYEQQRERFLNDPIFHALVQQFYDQLVNGQITQDTLRGALNFAITKFYFEYVRPVYTEDFIDSLSNISCSKTCKNFKKKNKE
jgi:hypothetical protein